MPTVQIQNPAKTDLDATHFPRRNEAGLAWSRAISSRLFLPKTRGFWPISLTNENDDLLDASGNNQTAVNTSAVPLALYGVTPYAQLTGSDYFSVASAAPNKITGALTLVCFARFNDLSVENGLISKWGAAGNRSYRLYVTSTGLITFEVSSNGTLITAVDSDLEPDEETWYSIIGQYDPGESLTLWVNRTVNQNVAAIPASIFDSTAALLLGNTNGSILDGDLALPSLHAAPINSGIQMLVLDYNRPLFSIET